MRILALALAIAACTKPAPIAPSEPGSRIDLYATTLSRIADGIYVAKRPEPLRLFVEGNVTIIINERDVVVVDAGGAPQAARNVIAEIKKLTPNPVSYVIHTHIHRDHRFGVQEYVKAYPGVEIVAHPDIHQIVTTTGEKYMKDLVARIDAPPQKTLDEIARLRREPAPGNANVIAHLERSLRDLEEIRREYHTVVNLPPTLGVDRSMVLYRGKRTIEVRFLGAGDTPQDLVVYLPRERIVCSGDLVVHPFPYGYSDQPLEWRRTLEALRALDFDILVPGHGDEQRGKVYLDNVIALLRSVHDQVAAGVGAGLDLAAVRARIDLSAFARPDDPITRYYFREYFVDPHVERVFRALTPR
jgi:glyoxylase-like metal-dependent hydrolase (beta-lactamase superfamily II)